MIFVDSNIPMYVAGREHQHREPSLRFLARARRGDVDICTSAEVLQEILHRYASMGRPDLAGTVYDLFVEVCPRVLPVTLADTDRARALLRGPEGATMRDLVHAAVMLNHDITSIATFDDGFEAIPGITRIALR